MENKKLNLDDFKAKADSMETTSVLEKVSGGASSSCHCRGCEDAGIFTGICDAGDRFFGVDTHW